MGPGLDPRPHPPTVKGSEPQLQPSECCEAGVRKEGPKSKRPGLKSWFSALSVWSSGNDLTSLSLNFFTYKAGIGAVPTSQVVVLT